MNASTSGGLKHRASTQEFLEAIQETKPTLSEEIVRNLAVHLPGVPVIQTKLREITVDARTPAGMHHAEARLRHIS